MILTAPASLATVFWSSNFQHIFRINKSLSLSRDPLIFHYERFRHFFSYDDTSIVNESFSSKARMSHLAPYESFKRREWLELDEIRKREFFLFLSIEWIWWIFEIFNNFNFTNFVNFDHWNFGFSSQQMDFTIFHNLSDSTKCHQATGDNLYAQGWIFSVGLT